MEALTLLSAIGSASVIAVVAVLVTTSGLLERYTDWRRYRTAKRSSSGELTAAMGAAAAAMAGSVEELVGPLRAEVVALRAETQALRVEVVALRAVLAEHGIPHPLGMTDGTVRSQSRPE